MSFWPKKYLSLFLMALLCLLGITAQSQEEPIRYDFSGETHEENFVSVMGAGFGEYPMADVTYGEIPQDHVFSGATDGHGAIIQANPGEGVILSFPNVMEQQAALVRCTVRTNHADTMLDIAAVGQSPNVFISQSGPRDGTYFLNEYRRLSTFFIPPTEGLWPIIQVLNQSQSDPITAYLDNFEIILLDSGRFYSGEFLNGDIEEPSLRSVHGSQVEYSEITIPISLPQEAQQLRMVWIEPGTFVMGSPSDEEGRYDNESQHRVTLTEGFYMSVYEVTQAQWESVVGSNPAKYQGMNRPVEQISWNDCQDFIEQLDEQIPEYTFRLPTEAEWEYACRADTQTRYYWGNDPDLEFIEDYCWYQQNSESHTYDVGQKTPNSWRLHDMSGNVWEWCQDWLSDYPDSHQYDPTGPNNGSRRIIRGGGYTSENRMCRSANRTGEPPGDDSWDDLGFRIIAKRSEN